MQCISGACSKVIEPIVLNEPIVKPINIKWKKYMNITKVNSCSPLHWFPHKKRLHSGKYCHDLGSLFLVNKKSYNNPSQYILCVVKGFLMFTLEWFLHVFNGYTYIVAFGNKFRKKGQKVIFTKLIVYCL